MRCIHKRTKITTARCPPVYLSTYLPDQRGLDLPVLGDQGQMGDTVHPKPVHQVRSLLGFDRYVCVFG